MASLYLLIPISLVFSALAIAIFFWAVNSGQYEDLDGEAERLLFDNDDIDEKNNTVVRGIISNKKTTAKSQTAENMATEQNRALDDD